MTERQQDIPVVHNADASRFEVTAGDETAVAEYRRVGDAIYFTHTVVPEAMEGQGIGSALAHTALTYAREQRLGVVPQCRFIAAYLQRHREFQDLVRND